ncbi:MAG: T9SS type A sorting domain-containing protein [bacterium]|nr:T9SS type A sorting domain-containing protein [bacterium]
MMKRILPLLLLIALAALISPSSAVAQPVISDADTFRVVNTQGAPGTVVPIKLHIANGSATLLGFTAFVIIDTSKITFEGTVDGGTFFVTTSLINRGIPNVFNFQNLVMAATDSTHGSIIAAGDGTAGSIPIGSGNVLQFNVRIKPNIPLGTATQITIWSPNDFFGSADPRRCQYSDASGLNTILPTIISGTLDIDTGVVIDPDPDDPVPPVIAAISPNSYNVNTGTQISFQVSASDANSPQPITLSASGLPSGAQFGSSGSVSGNGSTSGTFSWTPNASQTGQYIITFSCVDNTPLQATQRQVTINVGSVVIVGDQIFTVSKPGLGPIAGGTPGLAGISIPVNLASTRDVYGIQYDFVYNPNVLIIDSLVPTVRLTNFTVYDNIGDTPGRIRVVAFGLNNEKVITGPTSAISDFWVTVRGSAPVGQSKIKFENAFEAISPDPFQPSIALEADTNGVFVVDPGGDVNGDGRVDIADMVIVVGYIIGDIDLNLRQFTAADMNRDTFVDVIDLQAIINQVFGGTTPAPGNWTGDEAELDLSRPISGESTETLEMSAQLPTDIAGVQVKVSYNPDKIHIRTPRKAGLSNDLSLQYSDNGLGDLVVLLYPGLSLNKFMTSGSGVILELPIELNDGVDITTDDLKLEYAVMTDPNAVQIPVKNLNRTSPLPGPFTLNQNYPNPFNPETSIEFEINPTSAGKQARLVVYNLLGQPINTIVDEPLAAGPHTFKWNGISSDGQKVASGVYFYRLTIGDHSQTKKMVLLK